MTVSDLQEMERQYRSVPFLDIMAEIASLRERAGMRLWWCYCNHHGVNLRYCNPNGVNPHHCIAIVAARDEGEAGELVSAHLIELGIGGATYTLTEFPIDAPHAVSLWNGDDRCAK